LQHCFTIARKLEVKDAYRKLKQTLLLPLIRGRKQSYCNITFFETPMNWFVDYTRLYVYTQA